MQGAASACAAAACSAEARGEVPRIVGVREGALRVHCRPGRGRCVVAEVALSPGTLILRQKPLVATFKRMQVNSRCQGCAQPMQQRLVCSVCKCVAYCSRSCQVGDWERHQEECGILAALPLTKRPTETMLLMIRLILERRRQAAVSKDIPAGSGLRMEEFMCLESHRQEHPYEKVEVYAQLGTLVLDVLRNAKEVPHVDLDGIIEDFCRFGCNNFTIVDDEMNAVGSGVFPVAALLNHSCCPNVCVSFDGVELMMRVTEDVQPGDELCISYIELGATSASRRKDLLERYFFQCECSACVADSLPGGRDEILGGMICWLGESCVEVPPDHRGLLVEASVPATPVRDESGEEGLVRAGDLKGEKEKETSGYLQCVKCDTLHPISDLRKMCREAEQNHADAESLRKHGDLQGAEFLLLKALKTRERICEPRNMDLLSTLCALQSTYIDMEEYFKALEYCRLTIRPYECLCQRPRSLGFGGCSSSCLQRS